MLVSLNLSFIGPYQGLLVGSVVLFEIFKRATHSTNVLW